MARKSLTKEQQDAICKHYRSGIPMTQIAFGVGCSARTARRVLVERGLIKTRASVSDEARGFMRVLHAYEINEPKVLKQILGEYTSKQARLDLTAKQEMNLENVQQFLNGCTTSQLAGLFYTSGLIKIAEMHNGSVMNATLQMQKAAQKGNVHYGQVPNYRSR